MRTRQARPADDVSAGRPFRRPRPNHEGGHCLPVTPSVSHPGALNFSPGRDRQPARGNTWGRRAARALVNGARPRRCAKARHGNTLQYIPVMTLYWVNGIPARPNEADWLVYLADQLLGRAYLHPPRFPTRTAEAGLGLPHSMYWFVATCSSAYTGQAVSLWEILEPDAIAGGLCPFDTGGLWHQRFEPDPPLADSAERVSYFQLEDLPLSAWPHHVAARITTAYDDPAEYVRGKPPDRPMTSRDHSQNDSRRAWSWEGRIKNDSASHSVMRLMELHWCDRESRRFISWLDQYDGLDDYQKLSITDVIRSSARMTTADLYYAVESRLLEEVPPR